MAIFPQFDALFCEEDQSDLEDPIENALFPIFSPQNALLLEDDDELLYLFSKERQTQTDLNPNLSIERESAVDWVIRVNSYHGFSNLTAILAINYLDRFVSAAELQREKPWMMHLVAVTSLSLAAKVEETQVPLLLDFQVHQLLGSFNFFPLTLFFHTLPPYIDGPNFIYLQEKKRVLVYHRNHLTRGECMLKI